MFAAIAEAVLTTLIRGGPREDRRGRNRDGPNNAQREENRANSINAVKSFYKSAISAIFQIFKWFLIFQLLLGTASLVYAGIYWLVMPASLHRMTLYFDYGLRGVIRKIKEPPAAQVDILARHTQWYAGDATPLPPATREKALATGQKYVVGLELELPQSAANQEAGVFMVYTKLFDGHGTVLASSARPAFLPHSSQLLRALRLAAMWPLYLSGIFRESETLRVPCFDFFEEPAERPLAAARVELSSADVQMYAAHLIITPQLDGIQWLMHRWFYTTAAAGTLFIACIELMMVGFVYLLLFAEDEQPRPPHGRRPPYAIDGNSNRRNNRGGEGGLFQSQSAPYVSTYAGDHLIPASGDPGASEQQSDRYENDDRQQSTNLVPDALDERDNNATSTILRTSQEEVSNTLLPESYRDDGTSAAVDRWRGWSSTRQEMAVESTAPLLVSGARYTAQSLKESPPPPLLRGRSSDGGYESGESNTVNNTGSSTLRRRGI